MVHLNSADGALRLLYIDDSEDERLLVKETISLTKLALNFCEADCPKSAIPFFTNHHPRPSIVLLDYNMGKHTGVEFLDWLRLKKRNRSVPVVMFTSSLGQRNVAECYAKGANHFLRKPTSFSRLQEVIRSLYLSVLHNTPEPIIDLREYIPDPRGPVVCPT